MTVKKSRRWLFAGHHARMKNTPDRRCSQCTCPFEVDPRVGDRQVACGSPDCQRQRHCDRCRAWHQANADEEKSHYEGVVVPFRAAQPDYQRRWRLGRRVREIREKLAALGGGLMTSLRALVGRSDELSASPTRQTQTGVLAGDLLDKAKELVSDAVAAIEQLEASLGGLRAMGL
jgi:hypothetical protein